MVLWNMNRLVHNKSNGFCDLDGKFLLLVPLMNQFSGFVDFPQYAVTAALNPATIFYDILWNHLFTFMTTIYP